MFTNFKNYQKYELFDKFFGQNGSFIMFCLQQHHIRVEFVDTLSIEQAVKEINELSNPQIIVWYIGCNGLRKAGSDYYKDNLLNPVLRQNFSSTFWLVDLTSWNAFKNPLGSIQKSNSCCDTIEQFSDKRIKCIRTSKIFKKIQEIKDRDFIDYFRKALRREFICEASKNFPNTNITIKEIFSNDCPIMTDWFDHDANKCYSIFQYLEGCLLIEEIFNHFVANDSTSDLEITFALPNDELKYYRDDLGSFQTDIEFIIGKRCNELGIKTLSLRIRFLAFQYGNRLQDRPYNQPGKVLKRNTFSYYDVTDIDGEMINTNILEN